MFGFLKEKLKKSVGRLTEKLKERPAKKPEKAKPAKPGAVKPKIKKPAKRVRPKKAEKEIVKERPVEAEIHEEVKEPVEEVPEAPPEEEKKPGFLERLRGIKEVVVEKKLTDKDVDSFFAESETDLLQANIALEAVDHMRDSMKKELAGKKIRRRGAEQFITKALEDSLFGLVNQGSVNLEKIIKDAKKQGRSACLVFLGYNGSGKTTSVGKVARYLMDKGYKPVLAAGDTFRAASIEQLEHHGNKLGVRVIKHGYGADSAAVVFDARKFADANRYDAVLADTAGRTHTDKNLMDELKKVVRVNKPDLKILVLDSLTGNDAVEQAKTFHEAVGVDCVIMAKTDVNEKGGSILSVSYAIKKPILFLGTGQEYGDLKKFNPQRFVKELME